MRALIAPVSRGRRMGFLLAGWGHARRQPPGSATAPPAHTSAPPTASGPWPKLRGCAGAPRPRASPLAPGVAAPVLCDPRGPTRALAPLLRCAPYDPAARESTKRATDWTGDKVPGTATGDDETPTRLTAGTPPPGHNRGLGGAASHAGAPGSPPADTQGTAGRCGRCDLRPPPDESTGARDRPDGPGGGRPELGRPGSPGGAAAPCVIAWDAKDAIGPQGQRSVVWRERPARYGHATGRSAFRQPVCAACASRADGPHAATAPRALRLRERAHDTGLQAARARQQTETFNKG